jgi:hypothetical protein
VLHISRLHDEHAFNTLARIAPVLAGAQIPQIALLIDHSATARISPPAWTATFGRDVRTFRCRGGLSLLSQAPALRSELRSLFGERAIHAAHLHGTIACLLAARALPRHPLPVRVVCSMPSREVASRWVRAAAGPLILNELRSFQSYAAVADLPADAHWLSRMLDSSAEVLPGAVSEHFFATERSEDDRPTVIVDGDSSQAIAVIARLSVLLNGREMRVQFRWVGGADAEAKATLHAAHIEALPAGDDAELARRLAQAWIFVHFGAQTDGAAPQAMASGLPCLLSDTPWHRELLRHAHHGFVCTSERDFVEKLVLLLRDRGERERMGRMARAEAVQRFSAREFETFILRAYGFSRMAIPPAQSVPPAPANRERHAWNFAN